MQPQDQRLRDIPGLSPVLLEYTEAAYAAHCLESEFINIGFGLAVLEQQVEITSLFDLAGQGRAFLKQLRDDLAHLDTSTLGRLLKRVRSRLPFDSETEELFTRAVNRRNYLVHQFFFAHCFNMFVPQGRYAMTQELAELRSLFNSAIAAARLLRNGVWGLLGMKEDQWRNDLLRLLRDE